MFKLGSIICDMCRIVICKNNLEHRTRYKKHLSEHCRDTKSGRTMHFCNKECMSKDTKPKVKT